VAVGVAVFEGVLVPVDVAEGVAVWLVVYEPVPEAVAEPLAVSVSVES
jgi:hypothetical protein